LRPPPYAHAHTSGLFSRCACDGLQDRRITASFAPPRHWRGASYLRHVLAPRIVFSRHLCASALLHVYLLRFCCSVSMGGWISAPHAPRSTFCITFISHCAPPLLSRCCCCHHYASLRAPRDFCTIIAHLASRRHASFYTLACCTASFCRLFAFYPYRGRWCAYEKLTLIKS